ncbi:hypothetical protein BDK51DRAFT_15689 [Blyttiomyces helicus]|uniref:Uracil catabolism protein 4 n=1 Tax=Blyttiomyces helicus TaxID=388810 RepID=A0A4P9VYP2_9FUNG|nr:hypothetical protein BDK51DRAFT_15689 [Blyttiomyces helicus]|eukprot:RKO84911.1 hypothetical protein BDK51DRAFT_15689 [Blyttiomyces helicus]
MTVPTQTMTPEQAAVHLRTLAAVRATCSELLAHPDALTSFDVHPAKIPDVVDTVLALITRDYPTPSAVPPHSRWRHFEVSPPGAADPRPVPRLTPLIAAWREAGADDIEVVRRLVDLFVVSVLVDAGAGDAWTYRADGEPVGPGGPYVRSEGLALASLDWFARGGLSSDPSGAPHRVDADALQRLAVAELEAAFQVSAENPLVGAAGRTELLRRLGAVCVAHPRFFAGTTAAGGPARPGNMVDFLLTHPTTTHDAASGRPTVIHVSALWEVVMDGISGIWPATRTAVAGTSLGDVWPSTAMAAIRAADPTSAGLPAEAAPLVAFHKLSQWLTYSLMEPIALLGVRFAGVDGMTGLAEYRNGGLLVDMGVITLKPDVRARFAEGQLPRFAVHDDAVVEWRALTVAILDKVGEAVRKSLGMSGEELPLVKVLEAGTWKAGREIAAKLRPKTKGPPIEIISDGTVF